MMYREKITVHSENHKEHIKPLCGQNAEYIDISLTMHHELILY